MLIDGKQIASQIREHLRLEVEQYLSAGQRQPALAVVQVGDNPASTIYVRNKMRAAEQCHIFSRLLHLPNTVTEQELLKCVEGLNVDDAIDGILVQLPLPEHINEDTIIRAIRVEKDVDGFHPSNAASLWLHKPLHKERQLLAYPFTIPCTPRGVMALLDSTGIDLTGKHAVVVGRSDIVGKPVAKLLLDRQCTVSIAHSHTLNLPVICREADILVVAVGHPHLITAECIKQGAIVIDVGINRLPDGKLVGDVDFEACQEQAAFITPVPGGVGPMTVAMLMQNTIDRYKSHERSASRA